MIKDFEMKYLGLSGWAQNAITRVLIEERQRKITDRREENHVMESRLRERRCYIAGFRDEGRRQEPRNARNTTLDIGKDKETNSALELL